MPDETLKTNRMNHSLSLNQDVLGHIFLEILRHIQFSKKEVYKKKPLFTSLAYRKRVIRVKRNTVKERFIIVNGFLLLG